MAKDRFSNHAREYATFRPHYPNSLFRFIFSIVKHFDLAWDAGTGNGQVAFVLADKFIKVIATDISEAQLRQARQKSNIEYAMAAEKFSKLKDQTVDLITVAQAIHWFNRPLFYNEVRRVLKPGGVLAIWGYGLIQINDHADAFIQDFYKNIVGPYWDAERKHIDHNYRTIDFPLNFQEPVKFSMSFTWTTDELRGYLSTWSAVQKYMQEKNINPVNDLIAKLNLEETINVTFPIFLLTGVKVV